MEGISREELSSTRSNAILPTNPSVSVMRKTKYLSFRYQVEVLTELSQLADQTERYSLALQAMGYKSFLAWEEFESSFCDEGELELHKKCILTRMKEQIATPDGLLLQDDSSKGLGAQIDPCLKRLTQMEREASFVVERRRADLYERFMRYRAVELINPAGNAVLQVAKDYASLFMLNLVDVFRPLGFQWDEFRSEPEFPVVSKPITEHWDICWSPESNRTLRWPPRERSQNIFKMSELDLRCYVRSHGAGGYANIPIGFETLDMMLIRIQGFVWGFGWAYSRFDGIEELRTVLSAHANLYAQLGSEIEKLLLQLLPSR